MHIKTRKEAVSMSGNLRIHASRVNAQLKFYRNMFHLVIATITNLFYQI